MKNKIKPVLLALSGRWPRLIKLVLINFMIFHFNIRGKMCVIRCYTLFFSMAEKQFFSREDINRFRSHTGKNIKQFVSEASMSVCTVLSFGFQFRSNSKIIN